MKENTRGAFQMGSAPPPFVAFGRLLEQITVKKVPKTLLRIVDIMFFFAIRG